MSQSEFLLEKFVAMRARGFKRVTRSDIDFLEAVGRMPVRVEISPSRVWFAGTDDEHRMSNGEARGLAATLPAPREAVEGDEGRAAHRTRSAEPRAGAERDEAVEAQAVTDDPYIPNVRVPSVGSIETVRVRDTGGTAIGVVHLFASGRAWARDDRHGMTSWHDSLKKAVAEVRRRTRCATRLEACP